MMKILGVVLFILQFFVLNSLLFSQEETPDKPVKKEHEKAVNSINRVELDRKHSPFSEEYISQDEIENQRQESVTEILRGITGLHIVRTSVSRGTSTSLFTRGFNSNHTLVLIDGFKVSRDGNNFSEFDLLNTDHLSAIEYSKGPISALYGSDAMAGAVNFVTKKGTDETTFEAELAAGKFSTYKERVGGAGNLFDTYYSIDYTQWQTLGLKHPNSDFFANNFSARFDREIGNKLNLKLISKYIDAHNDIFTNGSGIILQPVDFNADRDDTQLLTGVELNYLATKDLGVTTKFWNLKSARDNKDFADSVDTDLFFFEEEYIGNNFEVSSAYNFSPKHRLLAGVELEDQKIDTKSNFGGAVTNFDKNRGNYGGFLQDELQLGNWTFVTGVRLDDNEAYDRKRTERAAASYLVDPWGAKIRGSVGTAILEPTLSQTFGSFGNKDLDPERSFSSELGLDKYLLDEDLTVSFTVFYNKVRDVIIFQSNTAPTPSQFINGGDILTQGTELAFKYKYENLTALLAYTLMKTKTIDTDAPSSPTLIDGDSLLRRPNNAVRLGLNYKWNRFNGNLDVNYVDSRDDASFFVGQPPRETNDAFTKTDAALTYTATDTLQLYARVDNMFDVEYEGALGYPNIGVTYLFGVISYFGT